MQNKKMQKSFSYLDTIKTTEKSFIKVKYCRLRFPRITPRHDRVLGLLPMLELLGIPNAEDDTTSAWKLTALFNPPILRGCIKALCLRHIYDWCGNLLRRGAAAAVYIAAATMHAPQCTLQRPHFFFFCGRNMSQERRNPRNARRLRYVDCVGIMAQCK